MRRARGTKEQTCTVDTASGQDLLIDRNHGRARLIREGEERPCGGCASGIYCSYERDPRGEVTSSIIRKLIENRGNWDSNG